MLPCLEAVRDACLSVTQNVGHYEAAEKTDRYCVWAEDGEVGSLEADSHKIGQTIEGTIDYFTKDEDDENIRDPLYPLRMALQSEERLWLRSISKASTTTSEP